MGNSSIRNYSSENPQTPNPQTAGPIDTSWLSRTQRWFLSTRYTSVTPTPTVEHKKPVVTNAFLYLLRWHFWTIFPCLGTGVLLYLNFSGYIIGTEVGKTPQATTNILAMLQLAAKAHEAMITFGLVNIARQWIHGYLISDGTIFGLVGAEKSLENLSLLITQEFMSAASYGIHGLFHREGQERKRRNRVFYVVGFLFLACLLCSVSGPASAVLMVPQRDWSYETHIANHPSKNESSVNYPNVLINAPLANNKGVRRIFLRPPVQYWSHNWGLKQDYDGFRTDYAHESHHFNDDDGPVTVNSTTTWDRPLQVGANWAGSTNFSTVLIQDIVSTHLVLSGYKPTSKFQGSKVKFVADITGIETNTVCRRRRKQLCGGIGTNSSEWCYMLATGDADEGELRSSRDLLLIVDHMESDPAINITLPRFWMTEGRRTPNEKFTDTMVFVFEHAMGLDAIEELLTVCATTGALKSATALSTSQFFSAEQVQFHDYLAYFNGNSTTYHSPRTLLYHENWLDQTHALPKTSFPDWAGGNVTFPPRVGSKPAESKYLKEWATMILTSTYSYISIWQIPTSGKQVEAATVEVVAGGAFICMLLRIRPSNSQYTQDSTRFLGDKPAYPQSLMPEARFNYSSYIYQPIKAYHLVYAYRSTSRANVLSMTVLIIHIVIALLGSLWQWRRGGIIRAWNSIPEYGTLCLGSEPGFSADLIKNTCAGIQLDQTFKTFVKIGETSEDHLELTAVSPLTAHLGEVDLKKKYGDWKGSKKDKLD